MCVDECTAECKFEEEGEWKEVFVVAVGKYLCPVGRWFTAGCDACTT